jgi:cobalt/nickel transport system ATP-binding protein
MDENNVIIRLEDVSCSYPSGGPVLENVNFTLREGEKLGLIGPNGSGKSTFLHILVGLMTAVSGRIRIFGRQVEREKDFREVREKIGLLFQNADDQLFNPTVLEDVAFGPLNLGIKPDEARERSIQTLKRLNLTGFENRLTHRLSGGEKRLVALATVLVMEPRVLLLDEPVTGVDEDTTQRIMAILNNLDISYIIVSHEYDFLALTTREIYRLEKGRILYDGDSATLHSHYHRHPAGEVPHEHT